MGEILYRFYDSVLFRNLTVRLRYFAAILSLGLNGLLLQAQAPCYGLAAHAGPDLIYAGSAVTLGPATCGTGGTPPLTYNWLPSTGIVGASNICAPSTAPATTISYTLTVTDGAACTATDEVTVYNPTSEVSYAVPKKTLDGGYYTVVSNKVYFKFEEEYRSGTLNYTITDFAPASANVQPVGVSCSLSPGSSKNLGDNRYYIDLTSCSLTTSKFYVVEITSDKKEKFYLKFLK